MPTLHEIYMQMALEEAKVAFEAQEIPVGAMVVCQQQVIAKAHNQTERLQDVTAHAEILAITAASHYLGSKYLKHCTLYVTLEPCPMCAGAIAWAQIDQVVFGASDAKGGFLNYQNAQGKSLLSSKTELVKGVLAQESEMLLQSFFQKLRKLN